MINIGDKVPEFEVLDQDENTVKLSDYSDKKLIIYFYPKDNTPGCTKQACNLRDHYAELKDEGYEILGVSTDSSKSHLKFIDKFSLPFKLIVDTDKKLHDIFGVWAEKKMYGRTYMGTLRKTFVINRDGVLLNVIDKVKTDKHFDQLI